MNPPWPRRTVLTRTALLAPGRTTTSPALTSPAKTTSSTDDDNTARDDRLHPQCKHDMYGMCTRGKAGRPTRCLVDPAIPGGRAGCGAVRQGKRAAVDEVARGPHGRQPVNSGCLM